MAAMDEILQNYGKPPSPENQPLGQLSQGIQTGLQLAQREQQIKQQREQLEMQKQQHQIMLGDKMMTLGPKAMQYTGPAQDIVFNQMDKVGSMMGLAPLTDEKRAIMKQNGDAWNQAFSLMSQSKDNWTPENIKLFKQAYENPLEAEKALNDLNSNLTRMSDARLMALSRVANAQTQAGVKQQIGIENTTTKTGGAIVPKLGADGNVDQADLAKQAAEFNQRNKLKQDLTNQKTTAQTDEIRAGTDLKHAQTEAVPKKLDIEKSKADSMAKIAGTRLQQGEERIKQGYTRINSAAENQISNDLKPLKATVFAAGRAVNLLNKPDVTNGEFREALIDYSKALSGAGGSAFGREEGLADKYTTWGDQLRTMAGKVTGPSDAKVNQDSLNLLKSDLQNLVGTTKAQWETTAATRLENKRASGIHPEVIDKLYKNYGVTPPQAGQPAMNLSPSGLAAPAGQLKKASPAQIEFLKGKNYQGAELEKVLNSKGYTGNETNRSPQSDPVTQENRPEVRSWLDEMTSAGVFDNATATKMAMIANKEAKGGSKALSEAEKLTWEKNTNKAMQYHSTKSSNELAARFKSLGLKK